MNTCERMPAPCERAFASLRHARAFALSYQEYLSRIVNLALHLRLLALLTPNPGKGLPKVRIDAARIPKGLIEDRFHRAPMSPLCHTSVSFSDSSKLRSGLA